MPKVKLQKATRIKYIQHIIFSFKILNIPIFICPLTHLPSVFKELDDGTGGVVWDSNQNLHLNLEQNNISIYMFDKDKSKKYTGKGQGGVQPNVRTSQGTWNVPWPLVFIFFLFSFHSPLSHGFSPFLFLFSTQFLCFQPSIFFFMATPNKFK